MKTIALKRFIDEFGMEQTGTLFWSGYGLLGGGRAGYQLGYLTKRSSAESFIHENCAGEILYARHSHFDLYGNFIPAFCGGISLGKWEDYLDLQIRFLSGSSQGLLKILIESGPYGLYKMASEKFSYLQESAGYVDKCHLLCGCAQIPATASRFSGIAARRFLPVFLMKKLPVKAVRDFSD